MYKIMLQITFEYALYSKNSIEMPFNLYNENGIDCGR